MKLKILCFVLFSFLCHLSYASMPKSQLVLTSTQVIRQSETHKKIVVATPKLSFFQKIALKIYKKRLVSILEKSEFPSNQFLGFLLGFFLGALGVGIAYILGKDFVKGAWKGLLALFILSLVFVILALTFIILAIVR
jgi:hypothetical protein